jgi:hypothetical protein
VTRREYLNKLLACGLGWYVNGPMALDGELYARQMRNCHGKVMRNSDENSELNPLWGLGLKYRPYPKAD